MQHHVTASIQRTHPVHRSAVESRGKNRRRFCVQRCFGMVVCEIGEPLQALAALLSVHTFVAVLTVFLVVLDPQRRGSRQKSEQCCLEHAAPPPRRQHLCVRTITTHSVTTTSVVGCNPPLSSSISARFGRFGPKVTKWIVVAHTQDLL